MEDQRTLKVIAVSVTPRGLCVKLQGIRPPGGAPSTPAKEAGEPANKPSNKWGTRSAGTTRTRRAAQEER